MFMRLKINLCPEIKWKNAELQADIASTEEQVLLSQDDLEASLIEEILKQLNIFTNDPLLTLSECDFLLKHFHAKKTAPEAKPILLLLQKMNVAVSDLPSTQENHIFCKTM